MKNVSCRRHERAILLIAALAASAASWAQQATEQFIPLGSSPGLSAKQTRIGRVVSYDPARGILTLAAEVPASVANSTSSSDAKVTAQTRIWLDRSRLRLANVRGDAVDLRPGLRCEVRLQDDTGDAAEWIKVEAAAEP